jgi:ubiquinol-cytochrome c reductase cytochrome c1 subunit
MKKWIVGCMMALGLAGGALAAGASFPLDKAPDLSKKSEKEYQAALQNGAKLFVNYCLSCHSAAFMRFNRLQDIGLDEKQIKDNLLFTTDKVGEVMKSTINPRQAKEWFGANPPDLTLIARAKASHSGTGADYLYTYLRTYYRDESKATGWNNLAFPSVGMPHVLWELQGERKPIFEAKTVDGHETQVFTGQWEQVKPGKLSNEEYDKAVGDLVAYLQWMAEPMQHKRQQIGLWVLLFLGLFTFVAWRLNKAFWKDIK